MKEESERKLFELQLVNQQTLQIREQIQILDQELAELSVVAEGLEELGKQDKKREILIPLGAGIYAPGTMENTKKIVVSVGEKVAVEKSVEESRQMAEEQYKIIKKNIEQLLENLNTLVTYGQMLQENQ